MTGGATAVALERVREGLGAHQAGDLAAAARAYDAALALAPEHPDALHLRGVVHYQVGRPSEAVAFYRRALAANPAYPAALNNLAIALGDLGAHDEALAAVDRALALAPGFADAHSTRGNILIASGRPREALANFDAAIAAQPSHAAAHSNRGNALLALGEPAAAASAYRAALALDPNRAEAANGLGLARQREGASADAVAAFESAVRLAPARAAFHNNHGIGLREIGRFDAAIAAFRRAIALEPGDARAHHNLGNTLRDRGDPVAAATALERALEIDPGAEDTRAILVETLFGLCDWDRLAPHQARLAAATDAALASGRRPAEMPLLALRMTDDPVRQRRVAERWAGGVEAEAGPPLPAPVPRPDRGPIRLGYLSHDFRDHPIAHLIAGVLERHDRSRYTVSAYAYGPPDTGPHRARIRAAVDRFVDIDALSHRAAAERIRADGIDILVDLTGPTFGGRMAIAALRPAPVQVWYLGYPGTTGARFFDYVIGDPVATPPEIAAGLTEALVLLPDLFQPPAAPRAPAAPPSRAALGLPATAFVFASFNQAAKLDPALFDAWMRVLGRVPDAVLWVYAGHEAVADRLRARAGTCGIDPARLVVAPRVPIADHLARIAAADLALDTRFFNGGTTTSQVLGAGVPMLAIRGRSFAARMSASLLHAAGLDDCVTPDLAAYEARAVGLGNDPASVRAIRARLAAARSGAPFHDAARFVRRLEDAYAAMWSRRRAGLPPAPIAAGLVDGL